jgi:hypothetical protein
VARPVRPLIFTVHPFRVSFGAGSNKETDDACDGAREGYRRQRKGLPSSQAKRIAFDGPGRTVIDGPFAETRELVAGFWLWEVKDMDEAVAWVKRCPNPMPGPSEIEIRPLYELADLQRESDAGGHGNP